MLETRRYRVGLDIRKYIRRLILSCVFTAIAVALITGAASMHVYNQLKERLQSEHDQQVQELTDSYEAQISELESIIEENKRQHAREIATLNREHEAVVADLNLTIESITGEIETLLSVGQASFESLRNYWYVFKEAPNKSGLTLDCIRFVDEQCKKWNVNPQWMWHIYKCESDFTAAVDNAQGSGARGLGQVMPSTGKSMWERILGHGAGSYTHTMANDPMVNIEITVALLGRNLAANGSMSAALNLYSGGGGSAYYNKVVNAAKEHGITLNENNAHYPT